MTPAVRAPCAVAHARAGQRRRPPAFPAGVRRVILVCLIAGLPEVVACSEERPTGPTLVQLQLVSGDEQHASASHTLPQPLMVRVLDATGRPVRGELVYWKAADGNITPLSPLTDAAGTASARWQLGGTPGRQTASANTTRTDAIPFVAWADDTGPPGSGITIVDIETYDGSGQAVHPDHVVLPTAWVGATQALVATPFPFGDARYENPSMFTAEDLDLWHVPPGLKNPLALPREGFLSDPDALYDPDSREIRVYYRQAAAQNDVWLIRSADGVHWGEPELTVSRPSHQIISPTVVRRSTGDWLMWAVNAGTAGCDSKSVTVELRSSTDGVHWSEAQAVELGQNGAFPWHLDVEWIPARSEFWAVYPLKPAGGCTTRTLSFASSADGIHWRTYPSPLLSRGALPELMDVVYRATIEYYASSDSVRVWYSGARYDGRAYVWHIARESLSLSTLLERVSGLAPLAALPPPQGPPLTNETAP